MNHIAYVIPTLDRIGGAEQQLLLLARGMAQRGWLVSVVVLSGDEDCARSYLYPHDAQFVTLRMRKGLADPRGWINLHRWLMKERPEIVHAHLPHAALLARWSRLAAPVCSLVETIHSPAVGGLLQRISYRLSSQMADVIVSVSPSAGQPWVACHSIRQDQLMVIPNGIDLSLWIPDHSCRANVRQELGLGGKFVWLAVGRLHPIKDHATLLRAFAQLKSKAVLLIAGSGPLEIELKRVSKQLCLGDRVQFLGYQVDVLKWMRAADAFVLSSRSEGLPVALMEASACELPSVITDISGARDLLPDWQQWAVSPAADSNALALAMERVMAMPDGERREMGRMARQVVGRTCDLNHVLDTWHALYDSMLKSNVYPRRFGASREARDSTCQLQ